MNTMKKQHIASLLFLSLSLPVAATAWEGSWLIGLSGGWAEREGDIDSVIFHPAPGLQVTSYTTPNGGSFDSGYLWGLLAGYEITNSSWILGLEFNIDWQDKIHKSDDNVLILTDALGQSWAYAPHYLTNTVVALTFRAGYQVAAYFVPYIRMGAEHSDNKIRFSAYAPAPNLTVAGDAKEHMVRFVGGLGIEVPLPDVMVGLSARIEYDYHSRGKKVNAIGLASDNATLWELDGQARTNSVKASIVWNLPF